MGAFQSRKAVSDRTDILYLLERYTDEARKVRADLDREAAEIFIESIPKEDQAFFRELLGI